MITADQLVLHAIGDYVTQSDWMASNKTKHWLPAFVHAVFYSVPFYLFLPCSTSAIAIIFGTHYLIDRYRLARYVVWAKNSIDPHSRPWRECANSFGYPPERPAWMACWLMIAADNIMHVVINGLALYYGGAR